MVERTDEFIICDLGWIKLDAECLSMVSAPGADLMIGGVCDIGISTSVSNGGLADALILVDGPVL